jgi:hypothetical protein
MGLNIANLVTMWGNIVLGFRRIFVGIFATFALIRVHNTSNMRFTASFAKLLQIIATCYVHTSVYWTLLEPPVNNQISSMDL